MCIKIKKDPSGCMISLQLERGSVGLKAVYHIWEILQNLFSIFFPTTTMFTVQAVEAIVWKIIVKVILIAANLTEYFSNAKSLNNSSAGDSSRAKGNL